MRILFLSATCSKPTYNAIYNRRTKPMLDSSQKFFDAVFRGLAAQEDVTVDSVSVLPVSRNCDKRVVFRKSEETVEGINYTYVGFLNLPVVKTVTSYFELKKFVKRYIKKYGAEEIKMICDPLVLEAVLAAIKPCHKKSIELSCIITDLPMFSEFDGLSFVKRILYRAYNGLSQKLIKSFDKYVLLTEEMNDVVNPESKPYMVMECIQSPETEYVILSEKSEPPSVVYAGKLHKEFGMDLLADAVDMIKSNCEIHIYGDGNYKDTLVEKSKKNNKFFVHEVVPLEEILRIEAKSSVLINPRTSQGEFTQYSFPSKTVEYMSMGVPVIMFRLPGIPDEYGEYICYAEEETPESLALAVDKVLSMPERERDEFGQTAKKFVSDNKNYISQTKRIRTFLE